MRRVLAALLPALALAAPAAAQEPVYRVFAFGDSYGSGEGAPGLTGLYGLDGTNPTRREVWSGTAADRAFTGDVEDGLTGARRCHRSPRATAAVAARRLQAEFPDIDVEFRSFACSGARIDVGVLGRYKGIDNGNGREPGGDDGLVPSQLAQANEALEALPEAERRLDALLMNIGGNNLGFASVIQKCFELPFGVDPCSPANVSDGGGNDDAKDLFETGRDSGDPASIGLDGLPGLYRRLDAAIDGRVLAGLPPLALGARPRDVLLSGPPAVLAGGYDGCAGLTGRYDYDNRLRADERRWLTSDVFPRFVQAIAAGASASGWGFVDMTAAFQNGICAPFGRRINRNRDGLETQGAFVDTSFIGRPIQVSAGWVHPNAAGFSDMAARMAAALRPRLMARFTPAAARFAGPVEQTALGSSIRLRVLHPAADFPRRPAAAPFGRPPRAGAAGTSTLDVPVAADGSQQQLDLVVHSCGPLGDAPDGSARGCSVLPRVVRVLGGTPGTPAIGSVAYAADGTARLSFAPSSGAPVLRRFEVEVVRVGTSDAGLAPSVCGLVGDGAVAGEPRVAGEDRSCPEEIEPPDLPPVRLSLGPDLREAVVPAPGPGGTLRLRECTDRGCGAAVDVTQPRGVLLVPEPFDPTAQQLLLSPIGQAVAQLAPRVRAGRRTALLVGWRAWRGWRDLRSIDVELLDDRGTLATLRLDPRDGRLRLAGRGGRPRAGRTRGRRAVRSGAVTLDARRARLYRVPATAGFELPLTFARRGTVRGPIEVRLGATARDGRRQATAAAASAVLRR